MSKAAEKVTPKANKDIEKLKSDLELYDMALEDDVEDANSYYMKAGVLVKLKKATGDNGYFTQALENYNKALANVDNDRDKALYLADRSKLYIELGEPELAVEDMKLVSTLPDVGGVTGIYIKNTKRDITKLEQVQSTIKQLAESGKIDPELANALQKHAEVTGNLVVQIGAHRERLDSHENKIADLEAKLTQVLASGTDKDKLLAQMQTEYSLLAAQVQVNTSKIQDIEGQMAKLCTKEQFEKAAAEFSKTATKVELFGGKLKVLEDHSTEQDLKLMTIDETLKASSCFEKEKIKRDFEALRSSSPELFEYANNFYWTLSNYLLAYRAISSGLVEGVRDKGSFERMWDKVGYIVVTALSAAPVVGGLIGVIEQAISIINSKYQDMKFERKVAKINEIITNFLLEEDLSLAVASGAIQIAMAKKADILEKYKPNSKPNSKPKTLVKAIKGSIEEQVIEFENKLDKLLTKVTKISKSPDTPAYKMAIEDVILFINHIATHDIKLVTSSNKASLDKVITDVFMQTIPNTENALKHSIAVNSQTKAAAASSSSDKCIIAVLTGIEYENPLLNHPSLINKAIKLFGFDKALDLSANLSHELVAEAVANNDVELVLAGMVSLEASY